MLVLEIAGTTLYVVFSHGINIILNTDIDIGVWRLTLWI